MELLNDLSSFLAALDPRRFLRYFFFNFFPPAMLMIMSVEISQAEPWVNAR